MVHAYLMKGFGWSLDQVKEMSEVDLYRSLESLLKIEKRQTAIKVNLAALAAAAGNGNKDAVKKVHELINDVNGEDRFEENKRRFKEGAVEVKAPLLTAEQLANLKMEH